MFDYAISGICRWPGGVLESSPPAAPPAEALIPRFGHPTPPGTGGFGVALDRVTGLRNQRVLWKELAQRAVACSESSPLAVVVLDFDRFEEVNERYNRSVGDQVLRVCAEAARAEAPSANLAFRYRDDELVLLVPGDEEDGGEVAERVRDRIAAQNTKLPAVTVSVGVAVLRAPVEPIVALAKAGPALQAAKRAGGNRVVLTTELPRSDQNGNGNGNGHVEANGNGNGNGNGHHDGERTARRAALAVAVASLEARDRATAAHSEDVVTLCESIGSRLGLTDEQLDRLLAAAQLHDVGKLAMPTEILDKPGPLDDDEWEIIREHTVIGERMLRAVPEMGAVANMVRHSHESWDGSGYPDGLAGEEIPLASRIILCADAFHAIRSDRPYRAGRSADEALKEVQASAGRQFDPRVVEALVAVARDVRRANRAALPRPRRLAALLATLAVGGSSTAYAASEDVRHVVNDVVDKVVPGSALKTAEAAEDFSLRPIEEVPEIVPVAVLTPDLEFPALRDVAYDAPTYRGQSDGFSTVELLDSEGLLDLADERRSQPVAPDSPPAPEPQAAWPAPPELVVAEPAPAAPVMPAPQPVTATAPELLPVAEFIDPAPDETRKPTSNEDKKPEHPNGAPPGQEKDKEKDEQPSFDNETQTEPQDEQPPADEHPHGEPPATGNPHEEPPGQEKQEEQPTDVVDSVDEVVDDVLDEVTDTLPPAVEHPDGEPPATGNPHEEPPGQQNQEERPPADEQPPADEHPHGEPPATGNPHGEPPGQDESAPTPAAEDEPEQEPEQPAAHDDADAGPPADKPDNPVKPEHPEKPEKREKREHPRAPATSVVSPAPSIEKPTENIFIPGESEEEPPAFVPPAKIKSVPPQSSNAHLPTLPPTRPPEDVPAPEATETPTTE